MTLPKLTIEFKKTDTHAVIPVAKDNGDVGMDLHSIEEVTIPAGKTKLIDIGLQLASVSMSADQKDKTLPSVVLKIEGRSGLASKGIFPTGGIVDPSYRGTVKVALNNITDSDYHVAVGDRIAQMVVYPVYANYFAQETVVTVKETTVVKDSSRGSQGFGSSGR